MSSIFARAVLLACIATPAGAQTLQQIGAILPPKPVFFPVIAPSGNAIAALCADRKIRLLTFSGSVTRTINPGNVAVNALAYSQDGQRLAVGYKNGVVRIVQSVSGATLKEFRPSFAAIVAIALSPDGRFLAAGPLDSPAQLWDINRGVRVGTMGAAFSGSSSLAFSPDGRLLVSADGDAVVRVYDVVSGRLRSRFDDLQLESFAVTFTPDSKTLVIGGADRVVVAIDPATGKELRRVSTEHDPVGAVAVLGDGRTVVAYTFNAEHMTEGKKTVTWDLQTGATKVLTSGISFVAGSAVADGRLILVTAAGDTLKLWAVRSAER